MYEVSSAFVLRQVKYVYDWLKPALASSAIIAGRVNASARNTVSGCAACTSAISHSQNATGLVWGLSTRKTVTPRSTQCSTTPWRALQSARQSPVSKLTL